MNFPAKIFIIYAREDAVYKDQLIKALSPLKNRKWIESWHDGNIKPGQVWNDLIRQNLDAADLIVPLISNDFFASEYIQQVEISHAFKRFESGECAIVPVIVRACEWELDGRLSRLQALPFNGMPVDSWQKPDEAYKNVVAGIRQVIENQSNAISVDFSQISGKQWKMRDSNIWKWLGLLLFVVIILIIAYRIYGTNEPHKGGEPTTITLPADEQAFIRLQSKRNIPEIAKFLTDFPQTDHASEARQWLKALQKDFDFHLKSAEILYQGHEKEKAFEELNKARDINPDAPEIAELINRLPH